ncbi:transmembrane protein 45B-like [Glandiceps talaboti]
MGTFMGHIHPGLAFLSIGLMWTLKYCYLLQNDKYRKRARPRTIKRGRFMRVLERVPWEAVIKVFYGSAAALSELLHPPVVYNIVLFKDGQHQHAKNWQHLTMYSYFALSGFVDIFSQKCLSRRAGKLERLFLALAFGMETFLLLNHRHGKTLFENSCHMMGIVASAGCLAASAGEIWHPNQTLLPLLRAGFTNLQGTWFFHVAFLLYKPVSGIPWDRDSNISAMFSTMAFCWHMALNIVLIGIIYGTMYIFLGRRWRAMNEDWYQSSSQLQLIKSQNELRDNNNQDYEDMVVNISGNEFVYYNT